MGIFIPDMEMPKGCGGCSCSIYGECDAKGRKALHVKYRWSADKRPDWCPLVPVPEHGRLIDADAIPYVELYGGIEVTSAHEIDKLPTIIPADKEDVT